MPATSTGGAASWPSQAAEGRIERARLHATRGNKSRPGVSLSNTPLYVGTTGHRAQTHDPNPVRDTAGEVVTEGAMGAS
ncbi:MAG: hypothetical protein R3E39_05085 [Anaerolineae bacterium]